MSFDFRLAKELYSEPWSVDQHSLTGMIALFKDIRNGVVLQVPEEKYNSVYIQDAKSETRFIADTSQLDVDENFEGIGIINLNGPITRNGGASSIGTVQISAIMRKMANDNRIKSFIVLADSGGGASSAVQVMVDTINEIKQNKPVYGFVPKGGGAYSACYGIISACDKIYSESKMNGFGSCGTMLQFQAQPKGNVDRDGNKNIVVYATKSTMKNKAFNELIDNDNTEYVINEQLDPINEFFLSMIISNRPQLQGTKYDNGHTAFAKDCIGTFIDGIRSFEEVVSEITQPTMSISVNDTQNNINNVNDTRNTNSVDYTQNEKKILSLNNSVNSHKIKSKMTKTELKANHPDLYNEIYNEGLTAEKMRVGVWMCHVKTDPDAVIEGINSGEELNPIQTQQFLIKAASFNRIDEIKKDSPNSVTPASTTPVSENTENVEVENFYSEIDNHFKKN